MLLFLAGCSAPARTSNVYEPPSALPGAAEILSDPPIFSPEWSAEKILILRDLWIGTLPPLPVNPTNPVAGDSRAAALGHRLFFEPRLSANNQIACATCHLPERAFSDGQAVAHGTRPNHRNSMGIIGSAYAPWLLWDGHKDSLWAQAVEPIEAVDEHGSTRLQAVHLIANDQGYRKAYEALFGPLPALDDYDRFPDSGGPVDFLDYRVRWESMAPADQEAASQVFANMGKAIAAYERLLTPGVSRFDLYVQALLQGDSQAMDAAMSDDEVAGLRLFIGAAGCVRCHHGPLFSDFAFHNTGVPPGEGLPPDMGRSEGLAEVRADEFNCAGVHAGGQDPACADKLGAERPGQALLAAFRTPMLRSAAETAPYMHAGQIATLAEVMNHYNQAPRALQGRSELTPLDLNAEQAAQLEAFLRALQAPPDVAPELLAPPK